MTEQHEKKRGGKRPGAGRPIGAFGPKKRQLQLAAKYREALGGANITPELEMQIVKAAVLQSFAEESRRRITKVGAANLRELRAHERLEKVADAAVQRLNLPKQQ
jgi:hypothetical protein